MPKSHCSLIMLSLEPMYFDIKSVLNITNVFYVKRKKSQVDSKNVVNQKKIQNDKYLRSMRVFSSPLLYGLFGTWHQISAQLHITEKILL